MISYCIVCGQNNYHSLKLCLDSLYSNSTFKHNFEILIATSPSPTKRSFLNEVFSKVSIEGGFKEIPNLTLAKGLNWCVKNAKKPYLFLTSSDVCFSQNFDSTFELEDCDILSPYKSISNGSSYESMNGNVRGLKQFGTSPIYFMSEKFNEFAKQFTNQNDIKLEGSHFPFFLKRNLFKEFDEKLETDVYTLLDWKFRNYKFKQTITSKSMIFKFGQTINNQSPADKQVFINKWDKIWKTDDLLNPEETPEFEEKVKQIETKVKTIGG
jgi:hypothetical protein